MKKVLMATAVAGVLLSTKAYANDISVTINGNAVDFAGQGPVIADGRTLVPIRAVFETLGFGVDWNEATQLVTLTRNTDIVTLFVGVDSFVSNGNVFPLDVPAQIIEGRTLLPIRAVLESVGYDLGWDEITQTVTVFENVITFPATPPTTPDTLPGILPQEPTTPTPPAVTPQPPTEITRGIILTLTQGGVENANVTLTPANSTTMINSGTTTNITASTNNNALEFVNWVVREGAEAVTIADRNSESTSITVNNNLTRIITNVTIEAVYRQRSAFNFTGAQVSGTDNNGNRILIDGERGIPANDFAQGDTVNIEAQPADGFRFVEWNTVSGARIASRNNARTTITFNEANNTGRTRQITLSAVFERIGAFRLEADEDDWNTTANRGIGRVFFNGSSSAPNREFSSGDTVELRTDEPWGFPWDTDGTGEWVFDRWEASSNAVEFSNRNNRNTTLTFRSNSGSGSNNTITITAVWRWSSWGW